MKDALAHPRPILPPTKLPRGSDRMAIVEWDVENIYALLDQFNSQVMDMEARLHQLDNKKPQLTLPHVEHQHGA